MASTDSTDLIMAGGDVIVVFMTTASREEAEKISRGLVEPGLVACVNIVAGVRSIFMWQGMLSTQDEVLLVAKSRRSCFEKIVKTVRELHSYSVPEIIAMPILEGSADYVKWIQEVTVQ
jgi:periplasmic divalent cation tolerance protein